MDARSRALYVPADSARRDGGRQRRMGNSGDKTRRADYNALFLIGINFGTGYRSPLSIDGPAVGVGTFSGEGLAFAARANKQSGRKITPLPESGFWGLNSGSGNSTEKQEGTRMRNTKFLLVLVVIAFLSALVGITTIGRVGSCLGLNPRASNRNPPYINPKAMVPKTAIAPKPRTT